MRHLDDCHESVIADADGGIFRGDLLECNAFLNGFLRRWPATVILSENATLGPRTVAAATSRAEWAVYDSQGDVMEISTDPVVLLGSQWQMIL